MKLFRESRREMERASSSGLKLRHGGCLGHMTSVHRQTGQPGAGVKQAQLEKRKSSPNSAVAGIRTLVGKLQDLLLPQQRSGNEKKNW